jgi:hypothetical protein
LVSARDLIGLIPQICNGYRGHELEFRADLANRHRRHRSARWHRLTRTGVGDGREEGVPQAQDIALGQGSRQAPTIGQLRLGVGPIDLAYEPLKLHQNLVAAAEENGTT